MLFNTDKATAADYPDHPHPLMDYNLNALCWTLPAFAMVRAGGALRSGIYMSPSPLRIQNPVPERRKHSGWKCRS